MDWTDCLKRNLNPNTMLSHLREGNRTSDWVLLLLVAAYATCCALSIGTVYQTGYDSWAGFEQWDLPTVIALIGIAWPFQILAVVATVRLTQIGAARSARARVVIIVLNAAVNCALAVGCILAADVILAQRTPMARLKGLAGVAHAGEMTAVPDSVELLYGATCLLPVATYLCLIATRRVRVALPRLMSAFASWKRIAFSRLRRWRSVEETDPELALVERRGGRISGSGRALLFAAALILAGCLSGRLSQAFGFPIATAGVVFLHVGGFVLLLSGHQVIFRRDDDIAERKAVGYTLLSLGVLTFIVTLPGESMFTNTSAWSPADIPQDISDWAGRSGVGAAVLVCIVIIAALRSLATIRILLGKLLFPGLSAFRQWSVLLGAVGVVAAVFGIAVRRYSIEESSVNELQEIVASANTREQGQELVDNVFRQGVRANLKMRNGTSPLLAVCWGAGETWSIQAVSRYIVAELLRRGADPNSYFGLWTPLTAAVYSRDPELVRLLLQAGADVDRPMGSRVLRTDWQAKNPYDFFTYELPIYFAAERDTSGEIVKVLLDAGADVNRKSSDGSTPLHETRSVEVAQMLITAGADVNVRDRRGDTPIDRAASRGDGDVVGLLTAKGANLRNPQTP